jgi:hypothetical protein
MMVRDPVSVVRHYHDVLNAYAAEAVAPLLAATAEYHSPSVGVIAGRDAILAAMTGYFTEYPDQVAVDDSIELVRPGVVRCVWRLKATSRSTGKPYVRKGIEHVTVGADGLIQRVEVSDL